MAENITVLGLGSMAAAVTLLLHRNGHSVTLWGREDEAARVRANGRSDFMPDVPLPPSVRITSDPEEAAKAGIIVMALPSGAVREAALKLAPFMTDRPLIINAAKGIEPGTHMRLSEVIAQAVPQADVAVITGPGHAEEIAAFLPTAYVAAAEDISVAERVQALFMSPEFRIYTLTDMIGAELGGAVKNVIALAAGICDGLGFGDNARAALITRGLSEIIRLGAAMGALAQTFAGLTGVGDLIVTCSSMHSRNRRCGILLGQGKALDEAMAEIRMVVEGVFTARAALELSQKYNVDMPIVREINAVLFGGKPPRQAVTDLLTRERKSEYLG